MNTYIQDKLDEFKKKYPDMQSENDEYTAIPTVEFIEEYLTDYHNHILKDLEMYITHWKKDYKNDSLMINGCIKGLEGYLKILQDTNQKE